MLLSMPININDLPQDESTSGALPAGEYDVKIERASIESTKSGDGSYIKLMFRVNGPSHGNACIFGNLNIANRNDVAERIGKQQLRQLMEAIGLQSLSDTDQLIGGRLIIKISCVPDDYKISKGENDAMKNEIKAYKRLPGNQSAMPQPSPQQYHQPQPPAASATPQQQTSSAPVRPW